MRSMRLAFAVSLVFISGTFPLAAQNSSALQSNTIVAVNGGQPGPQMTPAACPVSLRAQHGADGGIRKVDKNRPEGIAQLLHLIITSSDSRQIVEARLRVRGTSGKGRVDRSAAASGGMDATRNLMVRFKPGAGNEVIADVWVPGMTAVLQVDLNSLTFADGSMQMFGAADGCRFAPELLMLVAKDSY